MKKPQKRWQIQVRDTYHSPWKNRFKAFFTRQQARSELVLLRAYFGWNNTRVVDTWAI